jgi:hypothetical protein
MGAVKEKINTLMNKLKELWSKFKAWINNLMHVVLNLFKSGEKLYNQYSSQIAEGYKRKGNKP